MHDYLNFFSSGVIFVKMTEVKFILDTQLSVLLRKGSFQFDQQYT